MIRAVTGNEAVYYLLADFSDLQQVRDRARTFDEQHQQLDMLLDNAGAFLNRRRHTPYGVEITFLVNYLVPFLLTNLLLPTLKRCAPARILNLSSEAYKQGSTYLASSL